MLQTNPVLIGDTIEYLHVKGMETLAKRITHKLISPSIASSPHQSGRSTPFSSRSLAERKDSKTSIGSIGTSVGGTRSFIRKGQSSLSVLERRSTQKSVVFEDITSAPSAKRMLENISRGLEARKSRSEVGSGIIAPRQTPHASGVGGVGGVGGISFGELRKALQDAVDEQKRSLEDFDEFDDDDGSVRSSMDSENAAGSRTQKKKRESAQSEESAVELVDNK